MKTSEPCQQTFWSETELPSMSSVVGSRAKILAWQESKAASGLNALDYGSNTPDLLAKYDPGSSSWRTLQRCLITEWATFSGPFPRSGTMRNGMLFQRPQLVGCTVGSDFGSRLIPTPTACDHKGSGRLRLERGANNNLRDWFKILHGFLYPPVAAVEYLMGLPIGHTDLKPSEMPLSPKSLKSSAEP